MPKADYKAEGVECTGGETGGADEYTNVNGDGDCRLPNTCNGAGTCSGPNYVTNTAQSCNQNLDFSGECYQSEGTCSGTNNVCNVSLP